MSRKMRVSYISPSFYPATKYGGPIFSTLYSCRELLKLNVDLDIHTTNVDIGGRLPVLTDRKIRVNELDGNYVYYHNENITNKISIGLLTNIPRSIIKADLVHVQSVFSSCVPVAVFFSFIFRKKIIISPRGSLGGWCLDQGSKFKRKWLDLFFRPFLSRIYWHVTSHDEKTDVINVFNNISDDKFLIIPNGIERTSHSFLSKEDVYKILGIDLDDVYILSSGRLDEKKGFDITIKAFSRLDNNHLHLVIMGEDYGKKESLEKIAHELNIYNRVHFIGHISGSEKWSIYKYAKVFCLNSRHENFGNVYLESLSVGTPIIASIYTPWGFINDTSAGFCIENNECEIAKKISHYVNSRVDFSEECKDISSRFYWDNIARSFKFEYERILNDN
ncbi:glycosyltransferase [Edwardsiella tarda]|uniref:glycosyltransferase n=1 Tax=Edwardsiella tarda TaxID=636 RepID=UPI000D50D9CE|nr:glycosyltransferase [Edwardsiella tarda]UCQ10400.1 glycosyltransferase [Edwardsiella tarda]